MSISKKTHPKSRERQSVTLKSSRYQPTRAELFESMTIPASPEKIMKSVVRLQPVRFGK